MLEAQDKELVCVMSKESWLLYSMDRFGLTEEEAKLEWYKQHEMGKYVICEAREDKATRLFIRDTSNTFLDSEKREGWWNIFTVCPKPVEGGIWFCKATNFYLDKNGYLQMKVDPIRKADDVDFADLFSVQTEGTWDSPAWWFMAGSSRTFFTEYKFSLHHVAHHEPNIAALEKEHPDLVQEGKDFGEAVLEAYLHNLITLEEIERCLSILSDWEELVLDISKCWKSGNLVKVYGVKYPLFCKKVDIAISSTGGTSLIIESIMEYINRQRLAYKNFVSDGEISALEGEDILGEVEAVLLYREEKKKAEKEAKKAAKKAAKAVK